MLNKAEAKAEILVVDDVPANLTVLSEILSSAHYGVAAVTSGKRALKRLQSYLADLILLDIQMPDMNGFETCHHIKENPNTAHIPIIFITAFSDVDSIAKGFSLGAVDYISKPFQEGELLARIKTHLTLQACTQQLEQKVVERTMELQQALDRLEQSKLKLVQQEKMSALGNVVAGVAHEVNNPIGFLDGSISNAKAYLQDLLHHLQLYQNHVPNPPEEVTTHAKAIELAFLCNDFPKLLNSMQTASDRIHAISTSLRAFSRSDQNRKINTNLHDTLDSALLILKYRLQANERRPAVKVVRQYGTLPHVQCFPGPMNQVFMNILANAIDMFDEVADTTSYEQLDRYPQVITIQTDHLSNQKVVQVKIRDNGAGIAPEIQAKIFDYLFTTKDVDKGTGLGLTITRQVVEEAHGGWLEVQTAVGQGTEFCIQLPL